MVTRLTSTQGGLGFCEQEMGDGFNNTCLVGLRVFAVLSVSFTISACVSDTLSQQDTQPQISRGASPQFDPIQRELAIAEMRAKSDQVATVELTNAYAENDGPTNPMSPSQQSAGIAELQQASQENNAVVTDPELEAKQRSIRQLQLEGQRHYNDAVSNIQN